MEELKHVTDNEPTMTVAELREITAGTIMVKSGFNSKVLCRNFDPKKHEAIGGRTVRRIWSEIKVNENSVFGNTAAPIICVYVNGDVEYEEYRRANDGV